MKPALYLLILVFCSCKKPGDFNAERKPNPNILWSKTYGTPLGDFAEGICKAADGGLVLAGTTSSDAFSIEPGKRSENFLVMKVSELGITQWEKTFGGEAMDYASAVTSAADGNFFIAGKTNSSFGQVVGFHEAPAAHDAWVIKIDAGGNLLWQKTLGGYKNDDANAIIATADGGCIVVGNTKSTDGDLIGMKEGLWIAKLSAGGLIEWQKTYGSRARTEIAKSITQTKDNNYLIAGVAYDSGEDLANNSYHGSNDALVLKIDGSGNLLWQKLFGGSNMDWGQSIAATKDGGGVLAGFTSSNDGDVTGFHNDRKAGTQDDMWVVKLDAAGNMIWQKALGGINRDRGGSVIETADGHFVASGFSTDLFGQDDYSRNGRRGHGTDDVFVVKLSPSGAIIWQQTFGGTGIDQGNGMVESSDGNLILLGRTDSQDVDVKSNNGWYDYWVVKFKG